MTVAFQINAETAIVTNGEYFTFNHRGQILASICKYRTLAAAKAGATRIMKGYVS